MGRDVRHHPIHDARADALALISRMHDHVLNVIRQAAVADDPRHAYDGAIDIGTDAIQRIWHGAFDHFYIMQSPAYQGAHKAVFLSVRQLFDDLALHCVLPEKSDEPDD